MTAPVSKRLPELANHALRGCLALLESLLIQQSESAGMELHDLGEMGEKVRQAVVSGVEVVFVLHVFLF